ncbi:MAG: hypothetical protein GYA50_05380 [Eubacteriaceae bacterium]|nr:hypothetical protein [Eubacteriaceae bacterium]
MLGEEVLNSAETEESNMQKRDNVSFGTMLYGKLRRLFAKKDSAGVIETAYEVMNSEEYKESEKELRRIVMSERGEGEKPINEINNASDNINSGIDNSINNNDIASDKDEEISIDDSNILNKGDIEFNTVDENISSKDNNAIDTDNALSENNAVNIDGINAVSDAGSEADVSEDTGVVNEEGQSNVINGENDIAIGDGMGYKGYNNKLPITKEKFINIIKTEPGSRPDPKTYFDDRYISDHLSKFEHGVTKIYANPPTGIAGPPDGTYAMPTYLADEIIKKTDGNISALEQLLGFNKNDLGDNPVRIDIPNPKGLRMPSGNEYGTNDNWIPGGRTLGGILEVIIDSPSPSEYTIKFLK